jgi:flavin reductase (DIM6/NTAB) family NADH-FMN oxidoreductase RutF
MGAEFANRYSNGRGALRISTIPAQTEGAIASAEDFRRAMRHLAGGVAIIATDHDGHRAGLAATAVCSVSADPPTILVCINAQGRAHEPIHASGRFSVNLLAREQEALARRFSGETGIRGEDRFLEGAWTSLVTGAPVLEGALASLDCRVSEVVRMATHSVFFGSVVAVTSRPGAQPLIYSHGTYGTFSPEDFTLPW